MCLVGDRLLSEIGKTLERFPDAVDYVPEPIL